MDTPQCNEPYTLGLGSPFHASLLPTLFPPPSSTLFLPFPHSFPPSSSLPSLLSLSFPSLLSLSFPSLLSLSFPSLLSLSSPPLLPAPVPPAPVPVPPAPLVPPLPPALPPALPPPVSPYRYHIRRPVSLNISALNKHRQHPRHPAIDALKTSNVNFFILCVNYSHTGHITKAEMNLVNIFYHQLKIPCISSRFDNAAFISTLLHLQPLSTELIVSKPNGQRRYRQNIRVSF
ncbi:hypothetical protein GYMLUDRAFT_250942 [Collybiopsis luxurians FD-317 M1]|uniref:Uncharacterized protein n=1 Tax=Collybiopsis luxurians FD-317 M1 TaxID=944289 RepID=A0A0D0AR26_9AGAR|nr:hypothetical protein GYMLUDRAFT_250942 [Collybiopsis luxurians FD-317 M1]